MTKGIILAAGSGTRLYPVTKYINKHLLPINDKPMIFYPLSVLMIANVKEVQIIINPSDLKFFRILLGDGKHLGMKISYIIQEKPNGIAEAITLSKNFINNDNFFLILGDNFFYGQFLEKFLIESQNLKKKAVIFTYPVLNPKQYGVLEYNKKKLKKIIEKPKKTKSNLAVTGLYYYPSEAVDYCTNLKPSKRGELEITDLNNIFIKKNKLKVFNFGRGFAWQDMGNFENLLETSMFVKTIEKRQGHKIALLEEISYKKKFINRNELIQIIKKNKDNLISQYLKKLLD